MVRALDIVTKSTVDASSGLRCKATQKAPRYFGALHPARRILGIRPAVAVRGPLVLLFDNAGVLPRRLLLCHQCVLYISLTISVS